MDSITFNFQPEVVKAYSEGDCWLLALKLHETNGWPLYWLGNKNGDKYRSWCHMFTIHDGKAIDINGIHELDDFKKYWKKTAKEWRVIRKSSDFIMREVDDFNMMTVTMRPKYAISSNVNAIVENINNKVYYENS